MARNATDRSPPTLDAFAFRTYDKVRYADTDRQGHVNNAAFSTFLEKGGQFVIAGLRLDFIAEIHWPGRVGIGTGVTGIGRSSIGLFQGLFQNDACVATAETTIVQTDAVTRRSRPLTAGARDFLARHVMPAA